MFISALSTIAKIWKQPVSIIDELMDKENMVCIYTMENYSAVIKKILPFVIFVILEGIMLSEISQPGKDKYCMISLICGNYIYKLVESRNSKYSGHKGLGGGENGEII